VHHPSPGPPARPAISGTGLANLEPPGAEQVHVGRQPIVNGDLLVVGYELLFRQGSAATDSGADPGDHATTTVILNTFTAFGLDQLVGEGLAFVNLTRPFIVGDLPLPFPPGRAVLELLETVPADPDVVTGAHRLARAGYPLAVDDFLWEQEHRVPLLAPATYVKVDISQLPPSALRLTVERLRAHDVVVVAERVETAEELALCRNAGFDLFQGYHLLRPETVTTASLTPRRPGCLDLLARLADPAATLEDLEGVVRLDPGLSLRILRAANSASTGLLRPVSSVREALVMLGTERLRSWSLLLVAAGDDDAGAAPLGVALSRARTCELLAPVVGVRPEVGFTAGLLSRLDVLLGLPLREVLDGLPLTEDLRSAVTDGTGPLGLLVRAVEAHEDGRDDHGLDVGRLSRAHLAAVAWTTATVGGLGAADAPRPR
jgi:c-di-GMP-related signal transduction protein